MNDKIAEVVRVDESAVGAAGEVSFADAIRVWARIGFVSFGGPAGQVALMHKELVEKRRWIDEERFLHAFNYCTLLPGPEAQQLAIYIGWLMHNTRGGVVAGVMFVLPGFLAILGLSAVYAAWGAIAAIASLFFGLKAAVLAIVVEALVRIGKRALRTRFLIVVAAISFLSLFLLKLPFPAVVFGAGLLGALAGRSVPGWLPPPATTAQANKARDTVIGRLAASGRLAHTTPSTARAIRTLAACAALWCTPIVASALLFGRRSVFVDEGLFFSKAAVVTFGGAYAVLTYVAQQAVEMFGWLKPGEMLDGLGLAETTPGPLIMVVEFVGFLGAFRHPGALSPWAAGLLGASVTVWVTFVPCFLWIFLGAPYVEALRANTSVRSALSTITAAVVGVILNLSVWFGVHVLFGVANEQTIGPVHLLVPMLKSVDVVAVVLVGIALVCIVKFHLALPKVLAGTAVAGLMVQMAS